MRHEPYRAALYIRLSKEDESEKAESNSVTSQRELMQEYLKQHPDIEVFDCYVDDGYSGTNFHRPGFRRMMEAIEAGLVDCVIVKDLSRFGRNAAESGHYIDDVFLTRRIRFIAIHNYIDTAENRMNAATHCISVGIQNVINESVAATVSVNVRGTLNVERQQGKFIGSFAPYGYRKDPEDRHRLIPDETVVPVVRRIYDRFLSGKSVLGIARELNEMGIPNPTAYKKSRGMHYHHPAGDKNDGMWPPSSVRRILRNRVYIGTMVQGVNTTISYKHKQCRAVPERDWYVVEGTHDAIITPEQFATAQTLFDRHTRVRSTGSVSLFAGLVRCADCGRSMGQKTNVHPYGTYRYYRCTTPRKFKKSACTNHTIRMDKLESFVWEAIRGRIALAAEGKAAARSLLSDGMQIAHRREEELNRAISEQEPLRKAQTDLYLDWKSGVISAREYGTLKGSLEERLEDLEQRISRLEQQTAPPKENAFLSVFGRYADATALTRPMLVELVEEILVEEGGTIQIRFRHQDAYLEIVETITQ